MVEPVFGVSADDGRAGGTIGGSGTLTRSIGRGGAALELTAAAEMFGATFGIGCSVVWLSSVSLLKGTLVGEGAVVVGAASREGPASRTGLRADTGDSRGGCRTGGMFEGASHS